MEATQETTTGTINWLDRPLKNVLVLNLETVLFAVILIGAVFTRFYILGNRVMSHDETSHTYFSWLLYQGKGYQHDPITHGPFQFHIVALSYFLFGDSDFTARIPSALFGIAAVAFAWYLRRYLGRTGALVAALLLTISPYMLYYDRYVRNESFVAFFGIVLLWGVLAYLETGARKYFLVITAMIVMEFAAKETAYIYTAQLLLFLAIYFIYRMLINPWKDWDARKNFVTWLIAGVFLGGGAGIFFLLKPEKPTGEAAATTPPSTFFGTSLAQSID